MKRISTVSLLATLLFVTGMSLIVPSGSVQAVPSTINYQGRLTNSSGDPLQGTFSVQFTIWDHIAGGAIKWQETQTVTTEADGSFAVLLGTVSPIIDTMFIGCQPSLGIKIESDPELAPRLAFTANPYALLVSTIEGAKGGTLTSKLTVGSQNTNTGDYAFTVGQSNTVSGDYSTVTGGSWNYATGDHSTVGGGLSDSAGGQYSVVSGGWDNSASSAYTTVAGGYRNQADGFFAEVGGGALNIAGGYAATIPGGSQDSATGRYSFAAGRLANARHAGSFVWADSTPTLFSSSLANQFNVRASGGTRIYSNNSLTSGVTLAAGASAWASVSDSAAKRNIRAVDGQEILNRLDQLPVSRWSYRAQDPDIEHIGPMAQDFYALFHLGESDTTISTIDPSGIALAAIKELNRKVKEIDNLKAQVRELKAIVGKLTADRRSEVGGK